MNTYNLNIRLSTNHDKEKVEIILNSLFYKNGLAANDITIHEYSINHLLEVKKSTTGRNNKYPFRFMNIGDAFVISEHYSREEMQKKGNAPRNWAKQSPDCKHYRFSVKKTYDNKILVIRIK